MDSEPADEDAAAVAEEWEEVPELELSDHVKATFPHMSEEECVMLQIATEQQKEDQINKHDLF